MKIEECLNWAHTQLKKAKLFYGHGSDNPWDEAVQLVLYVMELPAHSGKEVLNHPVSDAQKHRICELVKERIETRKPLSYLTHEAWFAGLPFYVDERVLIPRSPFAEWIENRFEPWIKAENVHRILEIGTGSGCMSIAAAVAFPDAKVDAVDISPNALAVAEINVKKYQLMERIRLIESNCFEALQEQRYDLIMSNPPYVPDDEIVELPPEYHHEPSLALAAKEGGLDIAIKILQQAKNYLTPHGILVVEVGDSDERLMKRFPKTPFIWLDLERGGQGIFVLFAADDWNLLES